jgi:hypothetical protein
MDKPYQQQMIEHLNAMPLPELGDEKKLRTIVVSEPEINAIYAVTSFVRSACLNAGLNAFWNHYGPTLETLLRLLEKESE